MLKLCFSMHAVHIILFSCFIFIWIRISQSTNDKLLKRFHPKIFHIYLQITSNPSLKKQFRYVIINIHSKYDKKFLKYLYFSLINERIHDGGCSKLFIALLALLLYISSSSCKIILFHIK